MTVVRTSNLILDLKQFSISLSSNKKSEKLKRPVVPIERILKIVSDITDISIEKICMSWKMKGSKKSEIVEARFMVIYFCIFYSGKSINEIGRYIGGRDHSTVLNVKREVTDLLDPSGIKTFRDKELIKIYNHVESLISKEI